MADGFSILAFLGSIKTAKETGILILDASKSRERAELEYKIASLTKTLTELENQARVFEKIIQEKDKEIERLKTLQETKLLPQPRGLSEECLKILELLDKKSFLYRQEIEMEFETISKQKVQYFLDILIQNRLIKTRQIRLMTGYELTDSGRKFMFE